MTQFRGLAARANYVGQDRPDIQFATKEVCRGMARPTRSAMERMKRLDDFTILGYPEELVEIRVHMESWWDIKLRGIVGDSPEDDKTITILNRVFHWDGETLTLKADSKHLRAILEAFDLSEESRGVTVPAEVEVITS